MARITGLNQCSPLPLFLRRVFPPFELFLMNFQWFLAQEVVPLHAKFGGRAIETLYVLCLL